MRSNTYIFGGPVPPAYLEAICAVCDILTSPEYDLIHARLNRNLKRLTSGAERLGLAVMGGQTPIISVLAGDEAATLEGCEWIKHFDQLNPKRRSVYACIESLINLADMGDTGPYLDALRQLYGAGTVEQAHALIMQTDRFMGIPAPGLLLEGCEMHRKLLAAYDKVHVRAA